MLPLITKADKMMEKFPKGKKIVLVGTSWHI